MRRPAAVLWDMDGTLVDTEPYWMATEREIVESFGNDWPEHHAKAIVGFDLLDAGAYIAEHGRVPLTPHEIVDRLLDGVIARIREEIPWRPGARELLADLRDAGVPCALVTMSWRRFVEPVLEALPPGSFDVVVTGDEVAQGKPHPEPYLRAADAVGVAPHDCVAIEDSPTGVRSALDAGCRVVGVPNVRDIDPAPGVTIVPSLAALRVEDLADVPPPPVDGAPAGAAASPRPTGDRWRVERSGLVVVGLALVTLVVVVLALRRDGSEPPVRVPTDVALDAWAPYWTLDETVDELRDRAPLLREVSPFWYQATGVDTIGIDPNANGDLVDEFLGIARDSGAAIVPSIVDAMPAGGMAAILADPDDRAAHVDAIVAFADDLDADGIDLDYEQFAFADGRDTWEATRPNWVAFVTELAGRLRADGRTLTVSIPPVYDDGRTDASGYWVYDHGAIAEVVDRIRIMAYDFSTAEAGPIAPLDFVQRSVDGVLSVVDDPSKVVLGVPAYGYNWPAAVTGTCPPDAQGRTSVTPRSLDDLLARRGGAPVRDDVAGEWSFSYQLEVTDGTSTCTQLRQVHYVDGDGTVERIRIAEQSGLGGVSLWALGYEDDAAWALIDDEIRVPPTVPDATVTDGRSAG